MSDGQPPKIGKARKLWELTDDEVDELFEQEVSDDE
jgi:hypothetical protein